MEHRDRRPDWRRYAQRQRDRKLEAANRGRRTCAWRQGKYGECGGVLEHDVDRAGRVIVTCLRCERRRRGICQDCPNPVEGRVGSARRCRACKHQEKKAAYERYRARHPEVVARWLRATKQLKYTDPARYAHRLATKRRWRERNKARIKLQKRKWRLNPDRPNGYSTREKYLAYHTAYRAKHRERKRQQAKERYYRLHPDRPHPICACGCQQPIPWDGLGRPAKWLRPHRPYVRCLTPQEVAVKTAARAIQVLEAGADKIRKKLAGVKGLQDELAAFERAMAELKKVAGDVVPISRKRRAAAS